jgi:hypothetical protein
VIDRFSGIEVDAFCQDLCWSEPDDAACQGAEFFELNGLSIIAKAHQTVRAGTQWLFDRKVIAVWSAPKYVCKSGNLAWIMRVEDNESESA